MATSLELWFEYILRFSHLVAGISWIGSSFYFIWLDSSFLPPEIARKNVEGELFMVHGGFYYQVEKKKIYPGELPRILHWFKWEATLTWITGFFLFTVLYYLQGASLLVDSSIKTLTQTQAIGLSLGVLTLSWLIYDLLIWKADLPLPRAVRLLLSVIFLSVLIFGNFAIFSGRGAFMQTGMVFGSIMLLNVWVRILPGQAKMLREAQAGQVPDYSVSLKSKVRSVHNTYFTFPVLFIMLSNHFPAIYNHPKNAWLLIGLAISGALVRHAMVTKNLQERWTLLPAAIGVAALVFTTIATPAVPPPDGRVAFSQVNTIIATRCLACHSSHPTDDIFKIPPKDVVFESEAQVRKHADMIYQHVVVGKTMPLANKTGMTDDERQVIATWLKQ